MTKKQYGSVQTPQRSRSIPPRMRYSALLTAGLLLLLTSARLEAAFTEPRLALMRISVYRSTSGISTLKLEGSFSYADTVQLALPLDVVVVQGQLTARLDLSGSVFTSTGGSEQPASGPGVVSFTQREIVLVLPTGFSPGAATAQVVATYEGKPISSNRLSFTL